MMPRTGLKVSVVGWGGWWWVVVVVQRHNQVQPNFIVVEFGQVDVVVGVVTIESFAGAFC